MARARDLRGRRRGMGRIGTPAQLLDSRLALRVEPGRISPASRVINGTARYTDPLRSGTPRQLQPKYGLTTNGVGEFAALAYVRAAHTAATVCFRVNDLGSAAADRWVAVGGTAGGIDVVWTSDGFDVIVASDASNYTTYAYNGGALSGFHHVCVTVSGTTVVAYLNGSPVTLVPAATGTGFDGTIPETERVRIGADAADTAANHSNATFDDFRYLNSALTASQIADLAALRPGSTRGVDVGTVPLIHYKFEDPQTSPICRNSGSLGSAGDATITGTIANVRGTVSPVYSFANEVGGNSAWTSDGVADYINTQVTLNGATAFTVWSRVRYLSTSDFDLDGFYSSSTNQAVRIGRGSGNNQLFASYPGANVQPGTALPNGRSHTIALTAASGGSYKAWANGSLVASSSAGTFTVSNTTETYLIGTSDNQSVPTHFSHAEYYEYLIADRVLTDNELLWLKTRGASGTAIDVANDPNILVYYDFAERNPNQVQNLANPNLPGLIVSAGEWTTVPRDESDKTKDVNGKHLQYTGQAPRDMVLSGPCVTLNGINEYIASPIDLTLIGNKTTLSWTVKSEDADASVLSQGGVEGGGWRITMQATRVTVVFKSAGGSDMMVFWISTIRNPVHGEYFTRLTLELDVTAANAATIRGWQDGVELDVTQVTTAGSFVEGTGFGLGAYAIDGTTGGYVDGQFAELQVSQVEQTEESLSSGNLLLPLINWPLCEGAGNKVYDISGNGNHGTITGTPANVWANQQDKTDVLVRHGYSVGTWFNSANDWLVGSGPIGNGSTQLSVGAILAPDLAADGDIASCAVFTTTGRIWRWRVKTTGALQFIVSTDGTSGNSVNYESEAGTVTAGSIHQYDVTFDGSTGTCKFYKDGELVDTVVDVAGTGLHDTTTAFVIANNAAFNAAYGGTMLRFRLEPDAVWDAEDVTAMQSAVTPQEVADISGGIYYSPNADGEWWLNAAQQTSLTVNGAPAQRIIPAGPGLPPISYGPGMLAPGQSLDVYCGEEDAPISQLLAVDLSDGTYAFADGDEGDALFKKGDANGEQIAVINPAATGAELTVLNAWSN